MGVRPGTLQPRLATLLGTGKKVPPSADRFPRSFPDTILGEQRHVFVEIPVVGEMREAGDDIADIGLVSNACREIDLHHGHSSLGHRGIGTLISLTLRSAR